MTVTTEPYLTEKDSESAVLTLGETARVLNTTVFRVRYLVEAGRIPEVPRIAGRRVFRFEDIKRVRRALGKSN